MESPVFVDNPDEIDYIKSIAELGRQMFETYGTAEFDRLSSELADYELESNPYDIISSWLDGSQFRAGGENIENMRSMVSELGFHMEALLEGEVPPETEELRALETEAEILYDEIEGLKGRV